MNVPVNAPSPEELAKEVSLRYVTDSQPGFFKQRNRNEFMYYDVDGKRITDPKIKQRIESLKIPPAWEDVWICRLAYGHLQATGRDEKRKKQYIYHTKWTEIASQTKFDKMLSFSQALPRIRDKITRDMSAPGLTQERILATVVWLLDNTYIRIGNDVYAKDNSHYGLTTLRSKHVDIRGQRVTLEFTGKSGKDHQIAVTHPKVIKTIKKLEELPGYELFQYLDDKGEKRTIDSQDVNEYIRDIVSDNITAKDFRTWGGTVLAGTILRKIGDYESKLDLKQNVTSAVCSVAKSLGNTPKVCRGYYVHPVIVKAYEKRILVPHYENCVKSKIRGLNRDEYATTTLLKKHAYTLLN
jgi:DNA topoisomerase I